ncbi:hypothetical protein FOZ62_026764 [Perkinsus olseni]|uniref:Uncharacterized protein n=1 Tax=Perkinsus olseni TaxID=32597 RepID=A0A7J6TV09_PEROL|nr:hypothetical protein FOZ62_026764 [Perkinsus olseni]
MDVDTEGDGRLIREAKAKTALEKTNWPPTESRDDDVDSNQEFRLVRRRRQSGSSSSTTPRVSAPVRDDDISNEETLVTSGNSAISGTHEDTRQLSPHQGSATVDDEADAGHEENGVNNDEEEMVAPPEADDDDMIDPHTTEATPPTTSALEPLRQLLGSSRRLTFECLLGYHPCFLSSMTTQNDFNVFLENVEGATDDDLRNGFVDFLHGSERLPQSGYVKRTRPSSMPLMSSGQAGYLLP